jgi:hypothetical protein
MRPEVRAREQRFARPPKPQPTRPDKETPEQPIVEPQKLQLPQPLHDPWTEMALL